MLLQFQEPFLVRSWSVPSPFLVRSWSVPISGPFTSHPVSGFGFCMAGAGWCVFGRAVTWSVPQAGMHVELHMPCGHGHRQSCTHPPLDVCPTPGGCWGAGCNLQPYKSLHSATATTQCAVEPPHGELPPLCWVATYTHPHTYKL